jgi:hypothetical protein
VKASVFRSADEVIISVANWSEKDEEVTLLVDWARIELNAKESDIIIPEIKDFQAERRSVSLEKITIPGSKGYLIVIKKKI